MFQKIVVTLDGTPEAATVLPLAAQLLPAQDAELILVRVTPNYHIDAPVNIAARAELARVAAAAPLAGKRVRTALLYGDVAEQIVEEARSADAALIAMATHGRGGLARVWLGSVTEQVLAHSPVPVLVLRAGANPPTALRTVLVPFDATPGSVAALAVAREIASATGARIALVQVIPPLPRWGEGWSIEPGWEEETRAAVQHTLDWLAQGLTARGITASGHAIVGAVEQTIVAAAREAAADLIVMGTHALTGPKRALLGSVADAIMQTAPIPVLLVRQTNGEPTTLSALIDDQEEARPDRIARAKTED
jgi:nucleotide-binding universal stress UspA family protein